MSSKQMYYVDERCSRWADAGWVWTFDKQSVGKETAQMLQAWLLRGWEFINDQGCIEKRQCKQLQQVADWILDARSWVAAY